MPRKCPFCDSYDIIQLGKKKVGEDLTGVWGCRKCFKVFVDEAEEEEKQVERITHYNPKFKNAFLKKKIPELAEHANFKYEGKLTASDVKDLQIVWYQLKQGKSLEDLLNEK